MLRADRDEGLAASRLRQEIGRQTEAAFSLFEAFDKRRQSGDKPVYPRIDLPYMFWLELIETRRNAGKAFLL